MCGEAQYYRGMTEHCLGLSPRVRGSLTADERASETPGSIPACAGKPRMTRDNPEPGLSPRVRGSHVPQVSLSRRVYPRVCGEASAPELSTRVLTGLSPRVRGSRVRRGRTALVGSIPACAGKPSVARMNEPEEGVYPRVCGEAEGPRVYSPRSGLSPRVRGSLVGRGAG